MFLFWLRTNNTQEIIATLFQLKNQRDVSRYCDQVREVLAAKSEDSFVNIFLGPLQMTREQWLEHNNIFVEKFFFSEKNKGMIQLIL